MYPPLSRNVLPIPPADVLKAFAVHEPLDTRFRACARLLQSIWRQSRKLEMGAYVSPKVGTVALGSRLAETHARAGFNFLSPEIARLVRRELAYRERGALIEEERAWSNLLSSSALVVNLLGPLKLDFRLAAKLLKSVFSLDVKKVTGIYFETSPGRGDDRYIGDRTAFDALITYVDRKDTTGFIAIEVKYAESQPTTATPPSARLREVAENSELFLAASAPELFRPAFRQLTAEHCLAYTLIGRDGHFDEGRFVIISPDQNTEFASCLAGYQELLSPKPHTVSVEHVSLERMFRAIDAVGPDYLGAELTKRYLDFAPIRALVDDWEPHCQEMV